MSDSFERRWSRAHAIAMLIALGAAVAFERAALVATVCAGSLAFWVWCQRASFPTLRAFGAANLVTSARVLLLVVLAAASDRGASFGCALAAFCIFALDGLDGYLARRNASVSPFGARYDMETDAGFVLVLTVALARLDRAGLWVLFAGALRYIYVLTLQLCQLESVEAPRTRFGRHVFATSVIAFTLALIPSAASAPLSAAATALLSYSFGRSFYWSMRAQALVSERR